MPDATYLLALDQGTTGSRAILFARSGQVVAQGYRPLPQHYPQPGWVEHDPEEIWATMLAAVEACLAQAEAAGVRSQDIAAIGLTNQRETTVIWDAETGQPVCRAIVWQCRRTAGLCQALRSQGYEPVVRERTGLLLDPYFSATKLRWFLDEVPAARTLAGAGRLRAGTVDSWLLWRLTGGQVHATDATNASRTALWNLRTRAWDPDLLALFGLPSEARPLLPEVRPSADLYGRTVACGPLPAGIPIAGVAGDQQAALVGQGCTLPGLAKNTYGTGCFVLLNTGSRAVASQHGLLTTVAYQVGDDLAYALEGSVFIAGAVVQWLRDELGLVSHAAETEALARSVPDTGGVYVVPAFTGLGAPYWDAAARGTIVGLTRGTGRAHLVRAALEAIAYQTADVVRAMEADAGLALDALRVDGGASQNGFLMQFQADILGVPVQRLAQVEATAWGAAVLAGVGVGLYPDLEAARSLIPLQQTWEPQLPPQGRQRLLAAWHRAVERARGWQDDVAG